MGLQKETSSETCNFEIRKDFSTTIAYNLKCKKQNKNSKTCFSTLVKD